MYITYESNEMDLFKKIHDEIVTVISERFRCPLSKKSFVDPVIIECGCTFEKTHIAKYLESNDMCYCCDETIDKSEAMVTNYKFKDVFKEISLFNTDGFVKNTTSKENISDRKHIDLEESKKKFSMLTKQLSVFFQSNVSLEPCDNPETIFLLESGEAGCGHTLDRSDFLKLSQRVQIDYPDSQGFLPANKCPTCRKFFTKHIPNTLHKNLQLALLKLICKYIPDIYLHKKSKIIRDLIEVFPKNNIWFCFFTIQMSKYFKKSHIDRVYKAGELNPSDFGRKIIRCFKRIGNNDELRKITRQHPKVLNAFVKLAENKDMRANVVNAILEVLPKKNSKSSSYLHLIARCSPVFLKELIKLAAKHEDVREDIVNGITDLLPKTNNDLYTCLHIMVKHSLVLRQKSFCALIN